jgi:hypothetical protein
MSQIILFPAAALAYPDRTEALDETESLLLLAIRSWVSAIRHDEDPALRLELGLGRAGLHAAAPQLHTLMTALARTARRPIDVRCPRCPMLSPDEVRLLEAASLVQAGEHDLAERALALVLLSTQGAEFALEPLAGICALFAAAGGVLRRRRPSIPREASDAPPNPWPPAAVLH